MSNDIQTRDKQNRDVDSSEQYAINVIGDRALQSANLVVKESKRAVEKAMGGKSVLPLPNSKQNIRSSTPRQTPSVANAPPDSGVHTPMEAPKWQGAGDKPVSSEPHSQHQTERQDHFFCIADDVPGNTIQTHVYSLLKSRQNNYYEKDAAILLILA